MPRISHLTPPSLLGLLLVVSAGLSACRDVDGGDPLSVMLAGEDRGALSVDAEIPSLPSLLAAPETASNADLSDALEWTGRWEASWLTEAERGAEMRKRVYDQAVAPLVRALGDDSVRSTVAQAGKAVAAAEDAEVTGLSSALRDRVAGARARIDRANAALAEGDATAALRAALEGGDLLRAVSPRSVADALLERARAEAQGDRIAALDPADRKRVLRLIQGSQSALATGDFRRAIRRAYYACGLLGLGLSKEPTSRRGPSF